MTMIIVCMTSPEAGGFTGAVASAALEAAQYNGFAAFPSPRANMGCETDIAKWSDGSASERAICLGDAEEVDCLEAGAADQSAIDIVDREQFDCVGGLDG